MNTFKIYRERQSGLLASVAPANDWRWSLHASNRKLIAEGGEAYANATDLVRVVRKHIVRDSTLLEEALVRALKLAGLDHKGKVPLKRARSA